MFNCTPVFLANYNSKKKVVINQGGTSSSKTFSIMQLLFLKAKDERGVVITVVGQDVPNLKKGAYRDAETIYNNSKELKQYVASWNKSDRIITFYNGSIIEFTSYANEQDAKSGKRDYLFVNEGNGIDWLTYWQISIRTRKQIFIDYNPSAKFWVHDQLIGLPEVEVIISDHRHNTFLTEEEHYKIENIKDKELWKVYARGKTGNIIGTIYPDCQIIEDADYPKEDGIFWGLDLGYTNDPTCLTKLLKIADSIFIHECCYAAGLSATNIKEILKANGWNENQPVYTEHDPIMIRELRLIGVYAVAARKGPGSIVAGISKVKEYKIFITHSSKNIKEEIKRYVWLTDPDTGRPINTPIDVWNHGMDSLRMGIFTHTYRTTT